MSGSPFGVTKGIEELRAWEVLVAKARGPGVATRLLGLAKAQGTLLEGLLGSSSATTERSTAREDWWQ